MIENLRDVYASLSGHKVLYDLLKERRADESISHRRMPSWEEHCRFVDSRPYQFWYLIDGGDEFLGAIYLTERLSEIGCWIFDEYDSPELRAEAILALMKKHPRPRYVANINPQNHDLTAVFSKLGFRHIQNTYECLKP